MFAHQFWSANVQTLIERHGYGPAFLIAGVLQPLAFLVVLASDPFASVLSLLLRYESLSSPSVLRRRDGTFYGGNVVSGEMGFHLSHPMGKGETLSASA